MPPDPRAASACCQRGNTRSRFAGPAGTDPPRSASERHPAPQIRPGRDRARRTRGIARTGSVTAQLARLAPQAARSTLLERYCGAARQHSRGMPEPLLGPGLSSPATVAIADRAGLRYARSQPSGGRASAYQKPSTEATTMAGGRLGRRRDGVRIFAPCSAAGGMPKILSIRRRVTIGTRRRRSVMGRGASRRRPRRRLVPPAPGRSVDASPARAEARASPPAMPRDPRWSR